MVSSGTGGFYLRWGAIIKRTGRILGQTFDLVVDERPTRAGIDPYNTLIDRIAEDNVTEVAERW